MHKNEFMDRIVNNNQLIWKLVWMLRIYRTCNLTMEFSKYEFYKKLFSDITLFRVTPDVTWTQRYIYICIDTHTLTLMIFLFPPIWRKKKSLFMFFKRPSHQKLYYVAPLFFSFLSVYNKAWKGLETPTYSKCFIFTSMFLTSLLDKDFNPLVQRNFSLLS